MEPEGPPKYTAADITRELETAHSSLPRPGERGTAVGQDPVHVGLEEPVHPLYDSPGLAGGGVIRLLVSWCVEEFQREVRLPAASPA